MISSLCNNLCCLHLGLGDLVQEQDFVSKDGSTVLRYRCRLCSVQMDLYEMVAHVVGRRHRQKYLVRLRPFRLLWLKGRSCTKIWDSDVSR